METTLKNIFKRTWTKDDIHYWVNPENDTVNASVKFEGKFARLRAGILIIKGDEVLLGEEEDEPGVFSLPGGSLDIDESPVDAAIREAKEEVGIICKDVEDAGVDYCECHEEVKDWVKDNVPEEEWWYHYYTCLCIGEYDKPYTDKVEDKDKDASMKKSAQFYKIEDVIDAPSFKYAWKLALYNFGYIDTMPQNIMEKIIKKGSKYQVQSEKGRNLGTYDTKEEAEKRLKQVEYFKHLNEERRSIIVEDVRKLSEEQKEELLAIIEKSFPKLSTYNGNAMYLMPSGKYLDLGDAHLNAEGIIESYLNKFSLLNAYHPYQFQTQIEDELGIIHVGNDNWNYIRLPQTPITEKQYAALPRYDEAMRDFQNGFTIEVVKDNQLKRADVYYDFEQDALLDSFDRKTSSAKLARNFYNSGSFREALTEASRSNLISKSKSGANYKDGKGNRWTRKNRCTIANTVKDYNQIDMNSFFKDDKLKFTIRVTGETNDYHVDILLVNVLPKIARKVKENKNLLEFRCIYDALIAAMNSENIYINCDCPDFKMRFKYWATKNGYEAGDKENRPAKITNPEDKKGAACKHVLAALNNVEWLKKVASVINNYVNYCKDNLENAYAKHIFPKIYDMPYNKAVQLTLDDYDEKGELKDDIKTDQATINLANALGKERGKFKKGSNKNPASKK